ncbi:MAG: lactonase family protein [Bacteroidota bacterium]
MNRRSFLMSSGLGIAGIALSGHRLFPAGGPASPDFRRLFIGTYTTGPAEGINQARMEMLSGNIRLEKVNPGIENPSFLAISPDGNFLYAVNETGEYEGMPGGSVSAFRMGQDGSELTFLNSRSSLGAHPCHLTVSRNGKFVLTANYTGGNVSVLPVMDDGSLGEAVEMQQHSGSGPNTQRQGKAHAHSVNLSPDNRFAYVCDLGIDKVMIYRFNDRTGKLSPAETPFFRTAAGAGPRHFVFSPDKNRVFLINELNSTLSSLFVDTKNGILTEIQTVSLLPAEFSGENTGADVHVHPNGRFVYGSNRGHDSITVYSADRKTGRLKLMQHQATLGRTPRNFAIDPSGSYLLAANQNSNSIRVFTISRKTGMLAPTNNFLTVPCPVCVLIR